MLKGISQISTFKSKLIALMLGVTFISLFAASLGLALVQFDNYRKSLETSMLSNAAMLAFNLAPTLVFDDAASANQLLSSLETLPHIREAKVYRIGEQGQLMAIASYPESVLEHEAHDIKRYLQASFEGDSFQLTYPIELDGELIGKKLETFNFLTRNRSHKDENGNAIPLYTQAEIDGAKDAVKGKTEMSALVAYLQSLGHALK